MDNLIILGAGATYGASTVKENLKPPLLKDLPEILEYPFLTLNQSSDGKDFSKRFNDLVRLTGTRDNIELFFTIIFRLEIFARKRNKRGVFIKGENEIKEILKSDEFKNAFRKKSDRKIAKEILKYYLKNKKNLLIEPANLRNQFQYSLREYMRYSIDNYYCKYHAKLFSDLDESDSVVNFNYDELADFTLFDSGKLNFDSFRGLGFEKITLPEKIEESVGVRYLKVHGSFNWWTDLDSSSTYYNLISQSSDSEHKGETFFPIVLPLNLKEFFYNRYEVFKQHFSVFAKLLKRAKRVFLVGKTFNNSDREIYDIIKKNSAYKEKELILINPEVNNSEYINFHEELFNAKCIKMFRTITEYYKKI